MLDSQQMNTIAFMKKVHARLGVCTDHRLEMSLARAHVIIKDVIGLINSEINTLEGVESCTAQDQHIT